MNGSPHEPFLQLALRLAARARGETSPNPLVGALLVRRGQVIGQGFHRRAGQPHAEIEALHDATQRGHSARGATLYVTLEPCCTHGRTPPCTDAIIAAGIRRVVVAATDPNPHHAGRGFRLLQAAGVAVEIGVCAEAANRLNEAFNHWIVFRTPWVTLKIAQTLDGKIATAAGDSQWITGEPARREVHRLRHAHDAILVGVETVLQDDPSLTIRRSGKVRCHRRYVVDTRARTPLTAKLLTDEFAHLTTIVVGATAPKKRIQALTGHACVLTAPERDGRIDLRWLMTHLGAGKGAAPVTSLLVEGGGEVHASFLEARLAHRFTVFMAPKVLGGRDARRAVGGTGFATLDTCPKLVDTQSRRFGADLMLTGRIAYNS